MLLLKKRRFPDKLRQSYKAVPDHDSKDTAWFAD